MYTYWHGHVDTYCPKFSWLKPSSQAKQRFFEVKDHRAAPRALQAHLWFSSLQRTSSCKGVAAFNFFWKQLNGVNTCYKISIRVMWVTGDKAKPFRSKTRAAQNSEAQWHCIEPRHRRPIQPTVVCDSSNAIMEPYSWRACNFAALWWLVFKIIKVWCDRYTELCKRLSLWHESGQWPRKHAARGMLRKYSQEKIKLLFLNVLEKQW